MTPWRHQVPQLSLRKLTGRHVAGRITPATADASAAATSTPSTTSTATSR